MISHTPAGLGHPYLTGPDERLPLRPVAGEPFELRATAPASVTGVDVEVERDGTVERRAARCRGAAAPDEDGRYGLTAGQAGAGHLTETMAAPDANSEASAWSAELPGLPAGTRLRYRFTARSDETPWFDLVVCDWLADAAALHVDAASAEPRGRLVDESVEALGDGHSRYRLRFALRLEPGERVVGFGERFDHLDQRGRFVDTAVFDQYKAQGARSYMPMPFAIVAGGGFGFHVDTGHRCFFDVGASDPSRLVVEVDLEPGDSAEPVTLRLFAGAPASVVAFFCERVGTPEPPPDWIYRLWLSGNEWNSQARVLAELDRSRAERIPVGVVVIEAWSDEQTFVTFNDAVYEPHPDGTPHRLADFEFPTDGRWPDPKGMVDELHRRDVKVLLWQIPLVASNEGQAGLDQQTMIDRGYCVRTAAGDPYRNPGGWFTSALMLDFTNPAAADWWLAKRRYLIDEVGVDGFKTDGGEHAWGSDLRYGDGSRGGETNNRYPVHYAAAYHRLLRSCGRPPVTFSRAGYTGSGAVPCHWAGDADSTWEAFRASIVAGLTASASGVFFWGWDIAGFSGELPPVELYLRATAMGALCPVMQLHSEYNHHRTPSRDRTPWNLAEQSGDERVLPSFRRFVHLRERLVPYLADQGRRAVEQRTPLMRALLFDHPGDERIWDFPLQYRLGDGLLVAPVTEPDTDTWRVYLPAGRWIDAWTGAEQHGGRVVEVATPIDRIPAFCTPTRADDLVPVFSGLGTHDFEDDDELAEVS